MDENREAGTGKTAPPEIREPIPAERVRALPLVSVALGSMALGFCLVYFVCRPEGQDRSATARPLAAADAAPGATTTVHGSPAELRTDVDAVGRAPAPAPETGGDGATVPPPSAGADAAAAPPAPPPADAALPPPAGLSLARIDVRKCAASDGVDLPRERCGRVRGIELFMARAEGTIGDCLEKSFAEVPRPSQIGVTLDVDFANKTRRVSVPGADEARARQFMAFRDCLEQNLGQPEYARIDHPLNAYRFVFLYDYAP